MSAIKTDHKTMFLKMKFNYESRGPGFWRLNHSLLNDPNYIKIIEKLIDTTWTENKDIQDFRVRWDLLKFYIQKESIRFFKLKAKERREKEAKAWEEINKLDRLIINGEADENDLNKYERAKETIEEIET